MLEVSPNVYVRHFNEQRPHRALDLRAPDQSTAAAARGDPIALAVAVRRRDLLGGPIPNTKLQQPDRVCAPTSSSRHGLPSFR